MSYLFAMLPRFRPGFRSGFRSVFRNGLRGRVFLAAVLANLPGLSGCASSYCGAPCDGEPKPIAILKHESVVNQYGSVFGYLEIGKLTPAQLQVEKSSLELLLSLDHKDEVILKALQAKGDSDFDFAYDDYSTGGSRFDGKGKLRLDAEVENPERRLPRLVSESQNRELFERYRRLHQRLAWLAEHPPTPVPDSAGNRPDTLWYGSYRAGEDTVSRAPAAFPAMEVCRAWGEAKAESYRQKAFAFAYECRRGTLVSRRKAW